MIYKRYCRPKKSIMRILQKVMFFKYQVAGVKSEEIKDFAKLHDPQRFHLDEGEEAKNAFWWLDCIWLSNATICFAPFCQQVLVNSGSVGAPGVNIKWFRPWHPNVALQVKVILHSKRLSLK